MSGWGATDSDESKPKWLTADQKEDVFANSSGWVVKAGSTMTGNGNTSATPEVLVALGSLATSLGEVAEATATIGAGGSTIVADDVLSFAAQSIDLNGSTMVDAIGGGNAERAISSAQATAGGTITATA